MNLIIDVGNTRVKLAVFETNSLIHHSFSDLSALEQDIQILQRNYTLHKAILSSVVQLEEGLIEKLEKGLDLLVLSQKTKVPFQNLYNTPATLGLDRIALMAAAAAEFPNQKTLVIDAGTCITYDFLTDEHTYYGGSISPGLTMRYDALSHFTNQLPKLSPKEVNYLTGKDTSESIHSGVIHGIINEVDGFIDHYRNEFGDLTVVLTGGDMKFLSKQLKNSIFATQNFLLVGLNAILNYNND